MSVWSVLGYLAIEDLELYKGYETGGVGTSVGSRLAALLGCDALMNR